MALQPKTNIPSYLLSPLSFLLSYFFLLCQHISPLSFFFFKFLNFLCLLISPLFLSSNLSTFFFAIAVTPLHHLTVTLSRHHTITSVQARCHRITSPLLKLTVTLSHHACNSSSSFQSGEE